MNDVMNDMQTGWPYEFLDKCLRRIQRKVERDHHVQIELQFRYLSIAKGRRELSKLRQRVVEAVAATDDLPEHVTKATAKAFGKLAEERFIAGLRAEGFQLSSNLLEQKRNLDDINDRQAVCLWLAWRIGHGRQRLRPGGLWQMWESVVVPVDSEDQTRANSIPPLPIPQVIATLFSPRAEAGGERAYMEAASIAMTACAKREAAGLRVEFPTTMADAHRRLAHAIRAVSDCKPLTCDETDQALVSGLAESFGVDPEQDCAAVLGAVREWMFRTHPRLSDEQARDLLVWVYETCHEGTRPNAGLKRASKSSKLDQINNDLVRGYNTLRDKVVRRMCEVVDNTLPVSQTP